MDKLNELASIHLGKASDGTTVKPYQTPTEVDSTLLVGVPRYLNREQYGINENDLPFRGYDVWNAYEFSTLQTNGFPISGWLKIVYSCSTPNIVESKSLKLYLNSYNMSKTIKDGFDRYEIEKLERRIQNDIAAVVGHDDVMVHLATPQHDVVGIFPSVRESNFRLLEDNEKIKKTEFNLYNETPSILQTVFLKTETTTNHEKKVFKYSDDVRSFSLRSNCRVTNQPDWGDVFIAYTGNQLVTDISLLQYIVSFRNENHFHEEVCECIYMRLLEALQPDSLFVACLYTRRGGIDINPVRSLNLNSLYMHASNLIDVQTHCAKLPRQ